MNWFDLHAGERDVLLVATAIGPSTMTEINDKINEYGSITLPTVSRASRKLEERGLAEIEMIDNRSKEVRITDLGEQVLGTRPVING